MDKITIRDIAVWFRVGVTEEERSHPQQLLIAVELFFDFTPASQTDDLIRTIDYFDVAQRLPRWGENRNWKLIEKLAVDLAEWLLHEFRPQKVTVEVKKRALPDADYVSARVSRPDGC
ncbi:MAG: dihydroneopterin aldolase [Candidatus Omnitrophica bacterium]|nr:dihydroneopterin aldolase [Candidatus Omnitrophota bacterium]